MKVRFVKMQAAGNDFVLVDEWEREAVLDVKKAHFASFACRRHWSVGSDGVIFVQRSGTCDGRFLFYNPDGTTAEMDGNGIRCFAKYLFESGYTDKTEVSVETQAGRKGIVLSVSDGSVKKVRVDMGPPQLRLAEVKVAGSPGDTFINQPLEVGEETYYVTAVGMGNPHAVVFVDDVKSMDVVGAGRGIRNLRDVFPKGVNVHFVQVHGANEFLIRSYERGVEDETLACGTGVCAAAVAAVLNRKADPGKPILFRAPGGILTVELKTDGENFLDVDLIGEAVDVFRGKLEYEPMDAFEKAAFGYFSNILPKGADPLLRQS